MSEQRFGTSAHHYLPAGADVAAALHDGDEQALHAVWGTYQRRRLLRAALTGLATSDTDPRPAADHLRATSPNTPHWLRSPQRRPWKPTAASSNFSPPASGR
ncbi:hypothetical protein [Nocardia grenadensis]|uniref:hypothetical protein n=1 Tax=Nocardia grenadensis TaxID=931537 RepID=UPI0012EDBBD1|nr:hypothetical protein [Nocardia grenadensis]